MAQLAYTKPISASAVKGEVVITGPGPIHGSFEPDAVLLSLAELRDVSLEAINQQRRSGWFDPRSGSRPPHRE